MEWFEITAAILGGTAVAALINQIGETYRQKKQREAKKEDKSDSEIAQLKKALMYVILDRIRYLGQAYIEEGEIDFDDRRLLNEMHDVYHNGLGGNGDLDTLMHEVNALPLKVYHVHHE